MKAGLLGVGRIQGVEIPRVSSEDRPPILFDRFMDAFKESRQRPFSGDEPAFEAVKTLRRELQVRVHREIPSQLVVQHSLGKGKWVTIPWIAFLDSRVTTTTREGLYG